jgi:hypothetical protein
MTEILPASFRYYNSCWRKRAWRNWDSRKFKLKSPGDVPQRWPVSKRVNSSKADADDATLIEPVELAAA